MGYSGYIGSNIGLIKIKITSYRKNHNLGKGKTKIV